MARGGAPDGAVSAVPPGPRGPSRSRSPSAWGVGVATELVGGARRARRTSRSQPVSVRAATITSYGASTSSMRCAGALQRSPSQAEFIRAQIMPEVRARCRATTAGCNDPQRRISGRRRARSADLSPAPTPMSLTASTHDRTVRGPDAPEAFVAPLPSCEPGRDVVAGRNQPGGAVIAVACLRDHGCRGGARAPAAASGPARVAADRTSRGSGGNHRGIRRLPAELDRARYVPCAEPLRGRIG